MNPPLEQLPIRSPEASASRLLTNWRVLAGCVVVALAVVAAMAWRWDPKTQLAQSGRSGESERPTLTELKQQHGGDLNAALLTMANAASRENGEIEELSLDYSAITDDDLSLLAELPKLRALSLGGTTITDRGLEHLARLENLDTISLYYTGISDAGLRKLSENRHLRVVNLLGAHNAAKGVKYLKELPHLEALLLEIVPVTDEQIAELKELKRLSTLNLIGTRISEAGLAELRAALPNCVIYGP